MIKLGTGIGFVKYVIFTPLTLVGFASMYIFGGTIITLFQTIQYLFNGNFLSAFVTYFLTSALPPTSLGQVLIQVIVGSLVAGLSWFIAMSKRGIPFL